MNSGLSVVVTSSQEWKRRLFRKVWVGFVSLDSFVLSPTMVRTPHTDHDNDCMVMVHRSRVPHACRSSGKVRWWLRWSKAKDFACSVHPFYIPMFYGPNFQFDGLHWKIDQFSFKLDWGIVRTGQDVKQTNGERQVASCWKNIWKCPTPHKMKRRGCKRFDNKVSLYCGQ